GLGCADRAGAALGGMGGRRTACGVVRLGGAWDGARPVAGAAAWAVAPAPRPSWRVIVANAGRHKPEARGVVRRLRADRGARVRRAPHGSARPSAAARY